MSRASTKPVLARVHASCEAVRGALPLLLALAVACGSGAHVTPEHDASVFGDEGRVRLLADASAPGDAGEVLADASAPSDAGEVLADASAPSDAGEVLEDASAPSDAGETDPSLCTGDGVQLSVCESAGCESVCFWVNHATGLSGHVCCEDPRYPGGVEPCACPEARP